LLEPVAVPLQDLGDARDVGGVESKPENVHDPAPA
jgi:hypothetical protein